MISRLKLLLGAGLLALATAASAQTQPVVSVDVTRINVGGTQIGYDASGNATFSGGTTTTANETSGPYGTKINIMARAIGTNLIGSFTYTFYVNGISIGRTPSAVAPPSEAVAAWTPPQPGTYFITVTANDGSNEATSLAIRYFATGTVVNSPVTNTLVPEGSSVVLKADATVTSGFIKQIQFYDNGTAIGAPDTTIPYSLIYTPPTNVATHNITAVATDNNNVVQSASPAVVLQVVKPASTVPSCSISSPSNGSRIEIPSSGTPITVAVDAHSESGLISKVELYIDGVLFGTKTGYPYTFAWTPTVEASYNLVALAYDDKSNVMASTTSTTATSTPAPTRVVISAPPTVLITTPTSGDTVTGGSTIMLRATATASSIVVDGVTNTIDSVQFFANSVYIGSTSTASSGVYSISYVASQSKDSSGNVVPTTITALATDKLGLSTPSAGIVLTVTAGGSSDPTTVVGAAPTVQLTSPIASSQLTVNAPVTLTATANDTDGTISSVQFFVNGDPVGASDSTYPYSTTWTPTSLGTSYQLKAKATDNDGNIVSSTVVQVSVVDPSATAPTVAITSPGGGSTVAVGGSIALVATATDDVAVASVQFFRNGQPFGAAISQFPFKTTWSPTAPGAYTFVALATDNVGNQTTSSPVTLFASGGSAPAVTITGPASGTSVLLGSGVQITTTASDSDGTVTQVQILANGVPILGGTLSSAPYNLNWVPTSAGTYTLTAVATDNTGNTTTSSPVTLSVTSSSAPGVAITSPAAGSTYGVSTSIPLTASISAATGTAITQVQFFVNGLIVGTDVSAPYSVNWTPPATGTYTITAIATNNAAITTTSSPVTVTISGNAPPTVALTSPAAGASVSAGNVVSLAATAGDTDGTIASVRFLANGFVVGTVSAAPYLANWTPSAAGTYSIVAQATDSSGNVTTSAAVALTVTANLDPIVSLTSPRTGAAVAVATATTITASAIDPDGTIASVQFYANGVSLGTDTAAPYSVTWTPNAEGTYRLTAVAVDNSGSAVTSATVMVVAAVAGTGSVDIVASGLYINATTGESGNFSLINLHGESVTFIGYVAPGTLAPPAKVYYYAAIPLDSAGNFLLTDNAGAVLFSGQVSASGVSGSFTDGSASVMFAGTNTAQKTTAAATGYYSGSITGHPGSFLTGFTGLDGTITVYVKDGTFIDAGAAAVNATTGAFTVTTRSGNKIAGIADPATGLLTGTLTKSGISGADTFTGAQASGSTFSDGTLRNISSRGWVGTSDNVLIAGFVVNGTAPKQVLLRAVGPTLASLGVSGALANPILYLFNHSGTQIASNDNWGTGGAAITTAASRVGAFALPSGSQDSALLITLAPGVYSTQVSGVGGTTGISLVELYDVDTVASFSAEKMVNISTRGFVGTGDNLLIAGFVVNGTSPKKILVRGVGPSLATVGLGSGYLADPVLRIVKANGPLVRENDNWGTGNDTGLVAAAAAKIGAFPLVAGSKDAAILMNLPPGVYSAQLSGSGSSTGIGMIEVYEVQ